MPIGFDMHMGRDRRPGVFRWRLSEDENATILRDLTWDFAEPDQYPELVGRQKPGMMASKGEKAVHAAISSGDVPEILRVAGQNPKYAVAADAIAGLLSLETDLDRGIDLLRAAIEPGSDIDKDHFIHKYLPEAGLSVVIAEGLLVRLPLRRVSIVLLLAELYQANDRPDEALELLNGAEQTTHIRLSKSELLLQLERYEEVLAATQGVHNDDDFTALLIAYRGQALAALGRSDEALSAFVRVLEFPNRSSSVRVLALVGRGTINKARGELILADNDFTQALMEMPEDAEARRHVEEMMRNPG